MLTRIQKAFEKALYPAKCQACGLLFHGMDNEDQIQPFGENIQNTSLESIFKIEMSPFLCPGCIEKFSPISSPFCLQCGKIFKSPVSENHLCSSCIQNKRPYQRVRSACLHKGSLMEAIHQFKYAGKIQLARPLGRILFWAYKKYFHDVMMDVIVPVPLHASKFRARGFNQSQLMLAQWPDFLAPADPSELLIDFHGAIIDRKKKTESQTGLGREKRKFNVKNAFSVLQPEAIRGKQVLLVDDVYTTGATTEECAKLLMKSGARDVHILTLARAD
jgi:ComF family protein